MAQNGNGSANILRVILGVLVTVFLLVVSLALNTAGKASEMAFTNKEKVAVLNSQYTRIVKDLDEIKRLIRNK